MRCVTARSGWLTALATAGALIASVIQPLSSAQNPSLLFSTPITGSQGVRMTVDQQGYIYLAGAATGSSAFVMKLTPSRSVVYTTYFQGTRFTGEPGDCVVQVNAIAVDTSGAAYITGCTTALDFPVVNPFRSRPQGQSRGSGFVAKLSPAGTLVYSTYFPGYSGTAIAVGDDGSAYIAGIIGFSDRTLPLVNAASMSGPGFAAKLSPSGTSLVYSTYLAGVPNAMAVDRFGAAYFAGTGNVGSAAVRPIQPCQQEGTDDVVVIKLNPSGSSYDYATCLGGSKTDAASGIAVDTSGAAYIVGTTSSVDFPMVHPLDVPPRTGPLWKMEDAGAKWTNILMDGYSVHPILASKTMAGTWYAGALYGGFKSDDRGLTWRRLGLPLRDSKYQPSVVRLETDPRGSGTLYASTSEGLFKSTDDGEQWTAIGASLPSGGAYLRAVVVDPVDSRIVYAAAQRGFWKSADGGATWTSNTRGLGTDPYVNFLAVDPVTRVLYADVFRAGVGAGSISTDRVFISTDAGEAWTATPLEIPQRFVTVLTAVRARQSRERPRTGAGSHDTRSDETPTKVVRSTVYLAARQVFSGGPFGLLLRSDDGGETWDSIGEGFPLRGIDALAVASSDPRVVYAASSGPVFVSHDRGNTFEPLSGVSFDGVSALAVDSSDAGSLFVGTSSRSDAVVAKIRPGGGSLEYSTYLGGAATDRGVGVVVDDFGRAIVFGSTESDDFPGVAAIQPRRGATDAFVAIVDGGGSVLLFSSRLGGAGSDALVSMIPRGREVLISGGSSDLGSMFPDSGTSGAGAFVGLLNLPSGLSFRQTVH